MQRNYNASFQFCVKGVSGSFGGSGVAVWRPFRSNDVYIATAEHVIDLASDQLLFVIDYKRRKYRDYTVIVRDKVHDYALILISGVPNDVPTVILPGKGITDGVDCYAIGWPLLFDASSISTGCIRSANYTLSGFTSNVLVNCPIFGGNSGGGVFHKYNHTLIGLVSWGIDAQETLSGLIPSNLIYESLLMVQYEVHSLPIPYETDTFYMGVSTLLIDPYDYDDITPLHPLLADLGRSGVYVMDISTNSPLLSSGFINPDWDVGNVDMIWGIGYTSTGPFTLVNEENPIESIVNTITYRGRRRRRFQNRVISSMTNLLRTQDRPLSSKLTVYLLVSRIRGWYHQQDFEVLAVELPRRSVFFDANPSLTGEYLSNKRIADMQTSALRSKSRLGMRTFKNVLRAEAKDTFISEEENVEK